MDLFFLTFVLLFQTSDQTYPQLKNAITVIDVKEQGILLQLVDGYATSLNSTVKLLSSRRNSTIYETARWIQLQYTPTWIQWLRRDPHNDLTRYDRDLFGHDRRDIVNLRSNMTYLVLLKDMQEWTELYRIQNQMLCQGRRDSRDLFLLIGKSDELLQFREFLVTPILKFGALLLYYKPHQDFHILHFNNYEGFAPDHESVKAITCLDSSKQRNYSQCENLFPDSSGNLYGMPFQLSSGNRFLNDTIKRYINGTVCNSKNDSCKYFWLLHNNCNYKRKYSECFGFYSIHISFIDGVGILVSSPTSHYGSYEQYYRVFSPLVWLLGAVTYISLFIVFKYVFKIKLTVLEMLIEFVLRPLLQEDIGISQYVSSAKAKGLVVLMAVMGVILTTGFQTRRTSLMVIPNEEKQPTTLQELSRANDYNVIFVNDKEYALSFLTEIGLDNITISLLLKRAGFNFDPKNTAAMLKKTTIIHNLWYLKYVSSLTVDSTGTPGTRLYPVSGPMMLLSVITGNIVPFREKLATYLARGKSAGDFSLRDALKHIEDTKVKQTRLKQQEALLNNDMKMPVLPLTLEILSPCFVIFFCCLGISFSFLLIELFNSIHSNSSEIMR